MALLISDKVDSKTENTIRDYKDQENITILNTYAPNNSASKHKKQKVVELQR